MKRTTASSCGKASVAKDGRTRGVKQGHPSSAILFVIIFEFLIRALVDVVLEGRSTLASLADDIGLASSRKREILPRIASTLQGWAHATTTVIDVWKQC